MKPILVCCWISALTALPGNAALVANWTFEEGSGSATSDSVSSTASDAFGTGVTWSGSTAGPASGSSLAFTGATTAQFGVNLNASAVGINGSGAKTIVSWFKTSNATSATTRYLWGWSPINGLPSGNGTELRFGVQNGGLRFEVTGGAATNTLSLVNDGNWHMAAAIIDASDTIGTIQFYLDGNLIAATGNTSQLINTAGTGGAGPPTPNEFYIGSNGNGTANNWIGSIDGIQIYNTALSDAQLDTIRASMAVPEPETALLGGIGLLCLLRRRRA